MRTTRYCTENILGDVDPLGAELVVRQDEQERLTIRSRAIFPPALAGSDSRTPNSVGTPSIRLFPSTRPRSGGWVECETTFQSNLDYEVALATSSLWGYNHQPLVKFDLRDGNDLPFPAVENAVSKHPTLLAFRDVVQLRGLDTAGWNPTVMYLSNGRLQGEFSEEDRHLKSFEIFFLQAIRDISFQYPVTRSVLFGTYMQRTPQNYRDFLAAWLGLIGKGESAPIGQDYWGGVRDLCGAVLSPTDNAGNQPASLNFRSEPVDALRRQLLPGSPLELFLAFACSHDPSWPGKNEYQEKNTQLLQVNPQFAGRFAANVARGHLLLGEYNAALDVLQQTRSEQYGDRVIAELALVELETRIAADPDIMTDQGKLSHLLKSQDSYYLQRLQERRPQIASLISTRMETVMSVRPWKERRVKLMEFITELDAVEPGPFQDLVERYKEGSLRAFDKNTHELQSRR